MRRIHSFVLLLIAAALLAASAGCSRNQARNDAEDARERSQSASAEARDDSREAAEQTRAAAADAAAKARELGKTVEERTRDERAQAREALNEAGQKIKEGARNAATTVGAAAEGAREGWNRDSQPVDLNRASSEQLRQAGFSQVAADAIVAQRPFRSKTELVSRGIISQSEYQRLEARITLR